jgi:hypothetical protein
MRSRQVGLFLWRQFYLDFPCDRLRNLGLQG